MTAPPGAAAGHPRRATYRVQLHAGFGFDAVAAVVPYLRRLGVSHLYSSPYLQAAAGSGHGYDVVDHSRVSAELGGPEAFERFVSALGRDDVALLVDVVPNHMAINGRDNRWWWDVLEDGPASVYAGYFDVDWDPPESKLRGRVLLPILEDHYGRVLEAGGITLSREGGGLVVTCGDQAMPVAPRSLRSFLAAAAVRLAADDPSRPELESLAAAFGRLPPSWRTDPDSVDERHRDKGVLRQRLAELCAAARSVAVAVDAEVSVANAEPDRLDALLESQNYRLAWWRTAAEELDYRRFFDISTLVGLRQEDPRVFRDSHRLVVDWLRRGIADGARIDHVDGLRDPLGYLDRLVSEAPDAWVVVEKIRGRCEAVPAAWPVAGTTGYDWLNVVGGVLVDPAGEAELSAAYEAFTGHARPWADVAYEAKLEVLRGPLSADVRRLTGALAAACEGNRRYRDFVSRDLQEALEVLLASFPVYRTYVRPGGATPSDAGAVRAALATAGVRRDDLDPELLEFIRSLLMLEAGGAPGADLALRFQQVSSAAMAKGVEDTAFYRYVRLVSLNEVGGDPGIFGTTPEEFHAFALEAHAERPYALLATSTHDTKRGEDVRARLAVLSEVPGAWAVAVERWASLAGRHKVLDRPDATMEWLWYQTLVGAWPLSLERAAAYMDKAAREAGVHTSWTRPSAEYDGAMRAFLAAFLADVEVVEAIGQFVDSIAIPGWSNALAQKLLTLTAPGVPDVYQGTELWDLSLVDPDNRREVDYAARLRLLDDLEAGRGGAGQWASAPAGGAPKMLIVAGALALRAEHPEWFGEGWSGRYEPLQASGDRAPHVLAFMRGGAAVTVAPRLPVGVARAGGWGDCALALPPGDWRNRFTGAGLRGRVAMDELLGGFPVALLERRV